MDLFSWNVADVIQQEGCPSTVGRDEENRITRKAKGTANEQGSREEARREQDQLDQSSQCADSSWKQESEDHE
eukprot:scaffold1949_cov119-Cylindrotheca_fusiformis.AAC.10